MTKLDRTGLVGFVNHANRFYPKIKKHKIVENGIEKTWVLLHSNQSWCSIPKVKVEAAYIATDSSWLARAAHAQWAPVLSQFIHTTFCIWRGGYSKDIRRAHELMNDSVVLSPKHVRGVRLQHSCCCYTSLMYGQARRRTLTTVTTYAHNAMDGLFHQFDTSMCRLSLNRRPEAQWTAQAVCSGSGANRNRRWPLVHGDHCSHVRRYGRGCEPQQTLRPQTELSMVKSLNNVAMQPQRTAVPHHKDEDSNALWPHGVVTR